MLPSPYLRASVQPIEGQPSSAGGPKSGDWPYMLRYAVRPGALYGESFRDVTEGPGWFAYAGAARFQDMPSVMGVIENFYAFHASGPWRVYFQNLPLLPPNAGQSWPKFTFYNWQWETASPPVYRYVISGFGNAKVIQVPA